MSNQARVIEIQNRLAEIAERRGFLTAELEAGTAEYQALMDELAVMAAASPRPAPLP